MKRFKFKYNQIAILKKGQGFGVYVNVGIRFDSKVNCKRNPSKISYYIEGYEVRDWCFQEELRRVNFFNRIIIYLFKINKRFSKIE